MAIELVSEHICRDPNEKKSKIMFVFGGVWVSSHIQWRVIAYEVCRTLITLLSSGSLMQHFAVIGNPIAHSRSPQIHAAFARACGIELDYQRVLAPLDGFHTCVEGLIGEGFVGANVTVPFKLDAMDCADELSDAAYWAGAVNTLSFKLGRIKGDNTDGYGMVRDITVNQAVDLKGKCILLLGAGGAARGVLRPLLEQVPAAITVKNRSLDKAQHWLASLQEQGDFKQVCGATDLYVSAWSDTQLQHYDVIINATASGLDSTFVTPDGVALSAESLAYDMMYGKPTAFLQWAAQHGARTCDGWGMLVEQAARSFEIWHGVRPDTAPVLDLDGFLNGAS